MGLISASGMFDPDFYIREYRDVALSGMDPVLHYVRHGGSELRNPSALFDAAKYIEEYPDLRTAKVNPLLHYIQHGRRERRRIRRARVRAPAPTAPTDAAWQKLADAVAGLPSREPVVDVIVPIYRGLDETANCLYSVVRSRLVNGVAIELVVIDDASPEPELSDLLERLAAQRLFTLRRNAKNLGFVASVNDGMSLHKDRDVILLNSDTEVYGDWVARLRRAAYSEDNIGTVTPFSNNATICSYPNFPEEFQGLLELPFEELDQLAKDVNAGLTVDLPTAIGFCMYIRRECLDESGLFDAAAFGRGYGEENDFCLRIAARGWRNVLAGDVFVRHFGRVSFLDSTETRVRQALEIVDSRYPHYRKDVHKFIQTDPPRALRRNIDVARLRRVGRAHSVLFVTHDLEGGTPRHVEELIKHLDREGIGAFMLQPWPGDGRYGLLSHPQARDVGVTEKIDLRHDLPAAVEFLRGIGIFHIHFHHFMGFTPDAVQLFQSLAEAAGITYDFTAHDYLAVCPRVTMIGGNGVYCENLNLAVCEQCIKAGASPFGDVSVRLWRKNYEQFLKGARKIFVPDDDVKLRLTSILPSVQYTVRPHPEPVPEVVTAPIVRKPGEVLRVAIIGAIGLHKGSLQLQKCAEDAAARKLPIKFVLFGYSDRPEMLELPTIESTGPYDDAHLSMLLKRKACHISLFLSVWPETYSYTLSQAFFSGLYPVAFDIGAIARRIREVGWGLVLPFDLLAWPNKINDVLLECEVPPMPAMTKIQGERRYRSFISDYYGWDPARFGAVPADPALRAPAKVG